MVRGRPTNKSNLQSVSTSTTADLELCHGAGNVLNISAGKSSLGHTETAAGAVGILRAVSCLTSLARPEIMHLRSLNGYVTGSMDSMAREAAISAAGQGLATPSGYGCSVPRQQTPWMTLAQGPPGENNEEVWSRAMGVSAFAFQGTNAHVTLSTQQLHGSCTTPSGLVSVNSNTSEESLHPVWQKRRFWYAPAPHPILTQAASWTGASSSLVFGIQLQQPRLAYLTDHQVRNDSLNILICTVYVEHTFIQAFSARPPK